MNAFKSMFNKLNLAVKRKLQKKANDKFLKNSIPLRCPCCLVTGDKSVICSVAGYVFEKEFGTIYLVILGIGKTELNKDIRVGGETVSKVESWSMTEETIRSNFWGSEGYGIMDNEMTYMEDLPIYDRYLVVSLDRLYTNTLFKIERKKVKMKLPSGE